MKLIKTISIFLLSFWASAGQVFAATTPGPATIQDLAPLLSRGITFFFGIIGAIAIIMIIVGGIRYMAAAGDEKATAAAKQTITYAVVGLVVVLLAVVIVQIVGAILGASGLTDIRIST